MNKHYIGIDIGGTAVKIGLVTETGEILCSSTHAVNFDNYQTPIIHTVMKETDHFIQTNGIDLSHIEGIGVSATGQIDTIRGVVAGTAGHIDNWLGTPITQRLNERYQKSVSVANDANCAVMGEQWVGAAKKERNVIMITIGTGIGGGIITNNQLLSGSLGIAGELGHFPIKKDGALCSCGNIGCYEKYASTTALVKAAQEYIRVFYPNIPEYAVDGKFIFKELANGNDGMQEIVGHWIDDVATGLIGLIHIFNPSLVLIGGGVSLQHELFIEPLVDRIYDQVMPGFKKSLHITPAKLGNNAGLLGAVAHFIQIHKFL